MPKKVLLFAFLGMLACQFEASAQIRVVKDALDSNPTLLYKGFSGDQQVGSYVGMALAACGWFDVVRSGDADYTVTGAMSGSGASLTYTTPGGSSASVGAASLADKKRTAAKLVDAFLKKEFNVPGLCDTKIAFVGRVGVNKEIFVCDFLGGNIRQITNNQNLSTEPDWGLKNRLLVYTRFVKYYSDVYAYDFQANKTYKVSNFPGMNGQAAVSPNGKLLALILSRDRKVELYVKSLFGKGATRLTTGDGAEASPTWSPDGSKLCYAGQTLVNAKLFVMDLASKRARSIASAGSESVSPSWSFNNKIAYSAKYGGAYTIAVTDMATNKADAVPRLGGGNWTSPSWAPDGRHVVCAREMGHKFTLYIVDTKLGKSRVLLNSGMDMSLPSWSALY